MKQNYLLLLLSFVLVGSMALTSCSKDDDNEGSKNNPGKLAVTGGVTNYGDTWAEVEGFVNNTDKEGNVTTKVKEYGVEYGLNDGSDTPKIKKAKGLAESKFSVKLEGLTPGTKYRYRTYVIPDDPEDSETKYGSYKTFTTEKKAKEDLPYFEENGIRYEVKSESAKTAKVTKIADSVKDADILDLVTIKGNEYKVVEICEYVGKKHTNLKSLTTPSDITTIGNSAFAECTNLSSVKLGEYLNSMGDSAFYKCNNLSTVKIPGRLKTVNKHCFYHCSGLKTVTLAYGVENIGDAAFCGCTNLVSVELPIDFLTMGNEAFNSCSSLSSIKLPYSLTYMGNYAFAWCKSLSSISIPSSIKTIPNGLFSNCEKLSSVSLEDNITSIGISAFISCDLRQFTVPKNCTYIGNGAFASNKNMTKFTFNTKLTTIEQETFSGCTSLDIHVPSQVTKIGRAAFRNCLAITVVDLFDRLTEIEDEAFYGCKNVETIKFGTTSSKLTEVGSKAFYECDALKNIKCTAPNPPDIAGAFTSDQRKKITARVPSASLSKYQKDEWWRDFTLEGY